MWGHLPYFAAGLAAGELIFLAALVFCRALRG